MSTPAQVTTHIEGDTYAPGGTVGKRAFAPVDHTNARHPCVETLSAGDWLHSNSTVRPIA
ncbi:hypothetical protein JCM9533A_46890 [Catenuloplanes niger JCM 9533]